MFIFPYSSLSPTPLALNPRHLLSQAFALAVSLPTNHLVYSFYLGCHQFSDHLWCPHGAVRMIPSQSRTNRESNLSYHLLLVLLATLSSTMCHIKRATMHLISCLILFIQSPCYEFSHFTLTLFIGPMLLSSWIMPLAPLC